ncbi:MAG: molecular chaperone Hsp90 [Clostridium sp.]|nr:molecular chaperone Hsp90 [Clostridium sp.]
MKKELIDYITEKTHEMLSVDCCCQEARDAADMWLNAVETDNEIQVVKDYIAELEDDLLPIDDLINFAKSERGAEIFGENQADEITHAEKLKADGIKYCDCPACKAAQDIIAKKNEILEKEQ